MAKILRSDAEWITFNSFTGFHESDVTGGELLVENVFQFLHRIPPEMGFRRDEINLKNLSIPSPDSTIRGLTG